MKDRWSKLDTLIRLAPRRPREFADRVAHVVEEKLDRWMPRPGRYDVVPYDVALDRLAGVMPAGTPWRDHHDELADVEARVDRERGRLPPDQPIELTHCSERPLARCAYMMCRALKPEVVVETGVAYGVTTAYVLSALAANGRGGLDSIDLPPLGDEAGRFVGALVAPELTSRWTLHRGSTRALLPRLVRKLGRIDLFIHDSLHTFRTMYHEFDTAWARLPAGGALLSDDVSDNAAFQRFFGGQRSRLQVVVKSDTSGRCFGVAVK